MTATCPCGAQIRWGTNASGKKQPFNFDPDPNGNRMLDEFGGVHPHVPGGPVPEGYVPVMPHHATCPQARRFRR